jgi:hypothetical protein
MRQFPFATSPSLLIGGEIVQKELLTYGLLVVLAVGLLAHAFYPRYDWRTIDSGGNVTIVVYDRWAGRFQRALYDEKGTLSVMNPYTPF